MKKRVNNQVNRATGALKRWPVLLLCGLLLQSANLAAQSGGGGLQAASMLSLTGVPSGAVPLEIYRVQREQQYAIPADASLSDYTALDKVYMEPLQADERYLYAEDVGDNPIMIRQVVDQASQFVPQVAPHSHSVLYRDTSRIYNGSSLIYTVPLTSPWREPLDTTGLAALGSVTPDTLSGGRERVVDGDTEMITDRSEGLVFVNTYDGLGQWMSREVVQYDTDTTGGYPMIYRLLMQREEAPSGACIYRVETERYSEYGIWGTGLRSGTADPMKYSEAGRLKLSPNPVTDILRVELPELRSDAELRIRIYTLDGTVAQEHRLPGGTVWEADLSGLAPGVYLVRAEAGGQYWIEKVIRR